MDKNITTFLALESFVTENSKSVRGKNAMPDVDLAGLFEITIKKIHQIVAKNPARFPSDFMFYLNEKEKEIFLPKNNIIYAFTWGGILMLAGQIKGDKARKLNMQFIELFVDMNPGGGFEILSEIQKGEKKI